MRSWSMVVFAIAACGDREAASQVAAPTTLARSASLDVGARATPVPATPPKQAPHGAAIAIVALTDAGDAALTVDDQDHVRLWPTLDGKREPVIVHAPPARELALVRDRDELIAAVLDEVGGLEVIRHDATGALRGRARVASDPALVQIVGAAGGVLARRGDHTVLWIDGLGRVRSTLVPEPGEQVAAVVARRASAIAAIADEHGEVTAVRRIELRGGRDVRWGERVALPEALSAMIALSPSGRRIAGLSARSPGTAVMVELGRPASVLARESVSAPDTERILGFLDENLLVLPGGASFELGKQQPSDPWADAGDRSRLRFARGGAAADRIVVSPAGTALALATRDRTQFLGYRDLAVGTLRRTDAGIALVTSDRALWLDRALQITRGATIATPHQRIQQLLVLDGTHALATAWEQPTGHAVDRAMQRFILLDSAAGKEHDLGAWPAGTMVAYDPRTHVLINSADPQSDRLQLDLAAGTATLLRPFKTRMYATVEPVDPALADGVIAIAHMPRLDGGFAIETFAEDGKGGRKPIAPSTKVKLGGDVSVLGVDRRGVTWTLTGEAPRIVRAFKQGKRIAKFTLPKTVHGGAVAPDGETLIAIDLAQVFAFDARGRERWRMPAWHVSVASVASDGATVYLHSQGGLITVDVATGRRLATGCAWGFGLTATEPNQSVFGDALVCAEGGE